MTDIQKYLFELQDKIYATFHSKLIPTVDPELVIGVRVPVLRKYAKQLFVENAEKTYEFLSQLPHKYYEENMLHGMILGQIKDNNECINLVENFLPYIDNWAVSDCLNPKCFKKSKSQLLEKIKIWITSNHIYTIRFGIFMLMTHFLDDDFDKKYLDLVASIRSEEYYVNMMIAWYFATSLAKQWDEAIVFLSEQKLSDWTHNKAIQKAIESYRVTDEHKQILRQMKK